MTGQGETEQALTARAVAGDKQALACLLLRHHDRLEQWIAPRLPDDLQGLLTPEDVLQEAFVGAFQSIGDFEPRGTGAFFSWLRAIAWHRILDLAKVHRAAKRGRGRAASVPRATPDSTRSVVALLDLVAVDEHTPSRSAAGHEEIAALQVALAGLEEDYREALRLRYIEGLPVGAVAVRLGRTDGAIHMLCHRALRKMSEALKYLRSTSTGNSARSKGPSGGRR